MRMNFRGLLMLALVCAGVTACGTYSSTGVKPTGEKGSAVASSSDPNLKQAPELKSGRPASDATKIVLTTGDITDRKYQAIGDIEVTVNKATIFDRDPTPALVDEQLREKAAELGADAVIFIRYGTVGVSLFSWGSLDGEGRAVYFVDG
jgi:uncharacterized protein YbjQ (UPF0145 family)